MPNRDRYTEQSPIQNLARPKSSIHACGLKDTDKG
ncbi:uncharacterized protein G2W53_021525 [Senna tora]|uniref:Uncharacterized protein n=1 Tax=Senna tora TaxID=362788 RepID=A0A834TLZ3_9FABA|nr:uncharacterized protein G2W53_021525 [Senna tora]